MRGVRLVRPLGRIELIQVWVDRNDVVRACRAYVGKEPELVLANGTAEAEIDVPHLIEADGRRQALRLQRRCVVAADHATAHECRIKRPPDAIASGARDDVDGPTAR